MSVFQMALAFNWQIPATLLYCFRRVTQERSLAPVMLDGSSLAQGHFLFDQFVRGGDAFTFQLYEWTDGEVPASLHGRPRLMKIEAENFQHRDLFTQPVILQDAQFLDTAQPVPANESPFPGLSHLFRWLDPIASGQLFPTAVLGEQQIFSLRGKAVVVSLPLPDGQRRVRAFHFDPEMTVGDDGSGPDPGDRD